MTAALAHPGALSAGRMTAFSPKKSLVCEEGRI